jgi:ATP-binding cassette, subfamily B, bacterial MsbA
MQTSSTKTGFSLYKRLLWDVRSLWAILVIAVIGSIIYSAADAYSIYLIKPIINKGFSAQNAGFLKLVAVLILGLFILRGIGSFLSSYYMGKLGANVVIKYRVEIFNKYLKLPASFFDKHSSGKLLSRLLYNIDQIQNATGNALITIAQDGAFAIGLLTVMIVVSWKLSLTVLIVIPFLGVFISWISKRFRRLSKNTQDAMGDVTHTAEESIKSYKEIKVFGGQKSQSEKFYKSIHYTYKQQMKTLVTDSLSSPFIQIIGAVILSTVIYLAAEMSSGGHEWMTAGSFISFFTAMLAILKPVKNLTKVNSTIQKALAAVDDLYLILDAENEVDTGKLAIRSCKGEVEFKSVQFSYGDRNVLRNISFKVNSGDTIALVGKSGGGKSTLVNLIPRFYNPTAGSILIDGIDTTEISLENLRTNISLVSQNVNLFEDTVYNNIAFGLNKLPQDAEDVIRAAELAHAIDFINGLPEGMCTNVGENGSRLSGGQRQRVAIARAILKDAPILILDEATSALDNESEKVVQLALDNLMKDKTTFVVAHRLTTIRNADKIMVMDNGEVVEVGSHKELLELKGIYSDLYQKSEGKDIS